MKAQSVLGCDDWTARKRGGQLACSARRAMGLAQSRTWPNTVALLAFLGVVVTTTAQDFALDWFTFDGGGGTSTSGAFAVSGTIGQPDAHAQTLTGGNFSLAGGFWSLFAIQTPGAPLLTIQNTPTNTVLISWPSPSTGFSLQQNLDLNTTNWIAAPFAVGDDGANRFIIVNPPAGNRFYRLFKP